MATPARANGMPRCGVPSGVQNAHPGAIPLAAPASPGVGIELATTVAHLGLVDICRTAYGAPAPTRKEVTS